jgi:Ca2+/Na+ antiporter
MADRGWLFLFSILMIIISLGAAGYLFATGQALTIDGIFSVLVALLTALVFALYLSFTIHRAMEAPKPPSKTAAQS